ncbi:hypothetical protein GGX14DRAFT_393346 [Mycena pura]|uniref:Uncharacterized protein n=1 Tax=Mycena pura TaxID=153505 RepID=A0AAD6VHS0_9AGAR|nr:hypothetical protein GGX14DRAFT_393346 [Mycena pura]
MGPGPGKFEATRYPNPQNPYPLGYIYTGTRVRRNWDLYPCHPWETSTRIHGWQTRGCRSAGTRADIRGLGNSCEALLWNNCSTGRQQQRDGSIPTVVQDPRYVICGEPAPFVGTPSEFVFSGSSARFPDIMHATACSLHSIMCWITCFGDDHGLTCTAATMAKDKGKGKGKG